MAGHQVSYPFCVCIVQIGCFGSGFFFSSFVTDLASVLNTCTCMYTVYNSYVHVHVVYIFTTPPTISFVPHTQVVIWVRMNPAQMAKLNQQMAKMMDPRMLQQMGELWLLSCLSNIHCTLYAYVYLHFASFSALSVSAVHM